MIPLFSSTKCSTPRTISHCNVNAEIAALQSELEERRHELTMLAERHAKDLYAAQEASSAKEAVAEEQLASAATKAKADMKVHTCQRKACRCRPNHQGVLCQ